MRGYRRAPAAVAIVVSVIITTGFAVLGLYALLRDVVPFLKNTSLDAYIGGPWGEVAGAVIVALVLLFIIALIARVQIGRAHV